MRSEWFIALTPDGEVFDPIVHRRRDLDPDAIVMRDSEEAGRRVFDIETDLGDPGLAIMIERSWVHISRELSDGTLRHMGSGYLVPTELEQIDEDQVGLSVYCSPRNWDVLVPAALQPLKLLPGYDPLTIDPERRDDPAEILDGFFKTVWCDPITHELQIVDLFGVGLPEMTIADPDFPGAIGDAPAKLISRVDGTIAVEWIERRGGEINFTDIIKGEFEGDLVSTLTPDQFEDAWPKVGETIGGDSGYVVSKSTIRRMDPGELPEEPTTVGPVHGSSGVYNYVVDPNLTAPTATEFDLVRYYHDVELQVLWGVAQKRVEIVRFTLENAAAATSGGDVEYLDIKLGDVSIDEITPPWEPGTAYEVDDIRLVGAVCWKCTVDHVSGTEFNADLFTTDGSGGAMQRWNRLPTNQSPIGSPSATSYFQTARGRATIDACLLKARALIASSIRARSFDFETEITDEGLGLSAGMRCKVPAMAAPGGWVRGKVTSIQLESTGADETLTIVLNPAGGTGTDATGGDHLVTESGAAWDAIRYRDYLDQVAPPSPQPAGSIGVVNKPEDQLEYVQANDFDPDAGRDDPRANDPETLLSDVATELRVSLAPLSNQDAITHEIQLEMTTPWSGPWQYGDDE